MSKAAGLYSYVAVDSQGNMRKGEFRLASKEDAEHVLWDKGLTLVTLRAKEESSPSPWWSPIGRLRRSPDRKSLANFTKAVAVMSTAALPIETTMALLERRSSRVMLPVCRDVLSSIRGGASLSEALREQGRIFGDEYIAMVHAGERRGDVASVMSELSQLLDRRIALRSKIVSSLTYPILLILMSIGSVGIISEFLVPAFAPIFAETGREKPFIIGFVTGIQERSVEILILSFSALTLCCACPVVVSLGTPLGLRIEKALRALPGIGEYRLLSDASRFGRTLASLRKAGIPLNESLVSARQVCSSPLLRHELTKALDKLEEGEPLHSALRTCTALPEQFIEMVELGEASGRLEEMVLRAVEYCEASVQSSIDRFVAGLTPALTIGVAGFIGFVVISVMSAVMALNDIAAR